MTKKVLTEINVPFTVVDLASRPDLVEEFKSRNLLTAPIVVAGESEWAGFKPERLKGLAKPFDQGAPSSLTSIAYNTATIVEVNKYKAWIVRQLRKQVEKACPCPECQITDRIALQIENDFEDGILEDSK
jgi:glutaredoxin-like protein NrdH